MLSGTKIDQLRALARVIDLHAGMINHTTMLGNLTGGDLTSLTGLMHARLTALHEAMWA